MHSVVTIGNGAFYGCKKLEYVKFSKKLKTIGAQAFQHCPIKTVRLPKSVKVIKKYSFENTKLKKVYNAGSKAQWKKIKITKTCMEKYGDYDDNDYEEVECNRKLLKAKRYYNK